MPYGNTLFNDDLQKFWKRLRKRLGKKIKYYACGEYGDENGRPHYHAIIFGHDFRNDRYRIEDSNSYPVYRSPELEKIWTYGFSRIGSVSMDSASYVAGYVMKKRNEGQDLENWKKYCERYYDEKSGLFKDEEYSVMSRRPGIGYDWYIRYGDDAYPSDEIILRGLKMRPPKYYDYLHDIQLPDEMDEIKEKRLATAKKNSRLHNNSVLEGYELVHLCRTAKLNLKRERSL